MSEKPRRALDLLFGSGAALAALVLLNPLRLATPLTGEEVSWLGRAAGLAPRAVDTWIGAVADDRIMRLPVLLIALLLLVSVFSATRALGRATALLACVATAVELVLLSGPHLAGSPVPFTALVAGVCLLVLASGSRLGTASLLAVSASSALMDPGLAVLPFGAAAGMLAGPTDRESTRAGVQDPRSARVLAAVSALLLATLLAVHPSLSWHHREPARAATYFQMLVLTAGLAALAAVAYSARAARSSSPSRSPAEPVEPSTARLLRGMLGAYAAGLVWLLIPALRATSASPLYGLLLLAAPFAALAAGVAIPSPASRAPGAGGGIPAPRGAAGARENGPRAGVEEALTQEARTIGAGPPGRARWSPPVAAGLICAISAIAWLASRERLPDLLPLDDAVASVRSAPSAVGEVLAGPGLTRGALSHVARARGLIVVESPTRPVVGMVEMAARAPSLSERDRTAARLGERVLDAYGISTRTGPALRWATYRPLHLSAADGGPRPNIAIISVDTLRADHLGSYGYARNTSPHFDRWAAGGLVYERAMAAAPATAPSFSSLMTGRLPIAHGVRKNYEFLGAGNWTLPRVLKWAGYDTAAFVSSFVLTAENSGLDVGFDHYDQHLEAEELNRKNRPVRLGPELARAVIAWLDGRSGAAKPFFLWVHAIDPHGPYTPLPEFANTFSGGVTRTLTRADIPLYQWLGTLDFATYVNAYDSEILQTDASIGAILDRLEKENGPRGTILIFVADHGEAMGEHGAFFEHGHSLHVEEVHVPLVVKDSLAPRRGRVADPVSLLDVAPSILARLRIASDLPFDGIRLEQREAERSAFASNWRPGEVMACRAPWKVMLKQGAKDPAPVTRVYNIEDDPAEASPVPVPIDGEPAVLIETARALLARDPLSPAAARSLDRQQWEGLDPEAKEKLKSLGYAGP